MEQNKRVVERVFPQRGLCSPQCAWYVSRLDSCAVQLIAARLHTVENELHDLNKAVRDEF